MSKKLTLTDRYIKSPLRVTEAKASKDGRFEVRDADCRNLRVRFSETGYHSFVLVKRFPPSPSPTRRTIGACDTITLAEARDTAVQWRRLISQDIDPKAQARAAKAAVAIAEAAAKAEAQRIKSTAFNAVCEVYINEHVNGLAHWHEITAMVRFLAVQIGDTPIAEVTPKQCEAAVKAVKARAAASKTGTDGSGQARRHFGLLRHLFKWAMHTPAYQEQGLARNPMDMLDGAATAGKAVQRKRTLDDAELAAVWQAADVIGYPFGKLVHGLILTGLRRDELAEMRWSEVNLDKRLIEIPETRMKMEDGHTVPIAPMMYELLVSLPRFTGPCMFSANGGKTSFLGFHRGKRKLDQLSRVTEFTLHDLRRSMRSRLSALPIEEVVREAMIAHKPTGIKGIYNRYQYDTEKRKGYELYEAALSQVLLPNKAAA